MLIELTQNPRSESFHSASGRDRCSLSINSFGDSQVRRTFTLTASATD